MYVICEDVSILRKIEQQFEHENNDSDGEWRLERRLEWRLEWRP